MVHWTIQDPRPGWDTVPTEDSNDWNPSFRNRHSVIAEVISVRYDISAEKTCFSRNLRDQINSAWMIERLRKFSGAETQAFK
jgi:hypothetical protein